MEKGTLLRRLYEILAPVGNDFFIQEYRIGLGYVGVKVDDERMGLASLLLSELPSDCSVFSLGGQMTSAPVSSFLKYLVEGRNPLEKALGVATANALLEAPSCSVVEGEALSLMNLEAKDLVAMVGLFAPLVPKIEATGASLSVIERNPARMIIRSKHEQEKILGECTVAIITATTLLNDTLEEMLACLRTPRHVAILGPSTPMCLEMFRDTPVNHLGGARVQDTRKIMQIISEGGGTPAMRPYLRFVNLMIPKTT